MLSCCLLCCHFNVRTSFVSSFEIPFSVLSIFHWIRIRLAVIATFPFNRWPFYIIRYFTSFHYCNWHIIWIWWIRIFRLAMHFYARFLRLVGAVKFSSTSWTKLQHRNKNEEICRSFLTHKLKVIKIKSFEFIYVKLFTIALNMNHNFQKFVTKETKRWNFSPNSQ